MSPARLAVLVAAVASTVVVASSGAAPSPTFRQLLDAGIPIYCGGGTGPYVALTFDDGPGPYTAQLVALLKQYGARATFFEIGQKVVGHPGRVRMEASVGAIGDHSFTHPNLITLPPAQIRSELLRTQRAIKRITKRRPILFRPPFGDNASSILQIARSLGMLEVMWDADSGDGSEASTPPSEEIYQHLVDRVRAGAIVLMHEDETVPATLNALKLFLPYMQQKGFKAVTVPQLLRLDPPPLEQVGSNSNRAVPRRDVRTSRSAPRHERSQPRRPLPRRRASPAGRAHRASRHRRSPRLRSAWRERRRPQRPARSARTRAAGARSRSASRGSRPGRASRPARAAA
ncbi:MAG: polysaccharide deacetylase family protein [Actinobacteria bacterium]|nr:MAG: polysaccharide deacetylase family protein [Actinomycetota bacterium]